MSKSLTMVSTGCTTSCPFRLKRPSHSIAWGIDPLGWVLGKRVLSKFAGWSRPDGPPRRNGSEPLPSTTFPPLDALRLYIQMRYERDEEKLKPYPIS